MANINLTKTDLIPITFYVNGIRASAENLNVPLDELDKNIIEQKKNLDKVIDLLGSDDIKVDTLQEAITYIKDNEKRVVNLEKFKSDYDINNLSGNTQTINGNLVVNENQTINGNLEVLNSVSSGGNKLATENFVLQNAVAGESNVELTKIYEETITEITNGKTEFIYNFPGNSVDVYVGGLKLSKTDYSIIQKDIINLYSKIVLNKGGKIGEIISIVCYGGSDVYSVSQTDGKFLSISDAQNTYTKQTDFDNAKITLSSTPKFISTDAFGSASFGDFTGWAKPTTVTEIGTISTGIEWINRSAFDKEWLTAMGMEDNTYFYPNSFKVYRLTAPATRSGFSFPYIQCQSFNDSIITIAGFVKWVSGAVPYGWWCNGLTNSGTIQLCGEKNIGNSSRYIHTHPYKVVDTVDTIIEVAMVGVLDRDIDLTNPKNWWYGPKV